MRREYKMELQRGVCHLCSENSKVLRPSDAEEFTQYLPKILHENFLTKSEFQGIKDSVKICVACCFKVKTAFEIKNAMDNANEVSSSEDSCCRFCKDDSSLCKITGDWKYFTDRSDGFTSYKDFPLLICIKCFYFMDATYNFRVKLIHKFPQLCSKKSTPKEGSAKKRSSPQSFPITKRRRTSSSCFSRLQPLSLSHYMVDDELKMYGKLYRQIPYINLKDSKVNGKETPKTRPIIKIRLVKPKKGENNTYERLTKSEEVPTKDKSRKREYVVQNLDVSLPEAIDTTPKAATSSKLVPKRRVSIYNVSCEEEVEQKSEPEVEEANNIMDKYVADSTFTDKDKLELLDEIEDKIEKNGVEKSPVSDNGEESHVEHIAAAAEEPKVDVNDEEVQNNNKKPPEITEEDKSPEHNSEDKSPEHNSEGSDSESSDKVKDNSTANDSLTGSERKKKRVTFSDEIN